MARRFALYADAARHLRWRQVAHRGRRLVPSAMLAAGTRARPPHEWRPLATALAVDPAPQSGTQPPPEVTGEFAAVGRRRAFVDEPSFWAPGEDGLLFAFHLHGFAELARHAAGPRSPAADAWWEQVLESWLSHQGTPSTPAWHPYPTSGRIMAWCAALSAGGWPPDLVERMQRSLVRQAAVLRRSVEHDIGGNHVLRNACALVFAGACLGDDAVCERGLALLRRELTLQVLADGGHEERSTAYHRAVLADLGDVEELLRRARGDVPGWLAGARDRMAAWEDAMRGPDGTLPMFNDAWEGPPVDPGKERRAVEALEATGYVVLRHAADQAILDAGPVAPDHLPPHAHADVLSFVLWGDGRALLVDPGSYSYTGPERLRFRSTAAHSTVEIDGRDQCELWGDFRAAFMPRILSREVVPHAASGATVVRAAHDGYRRLPDPVVHVRTLVWLPGDGLVVLDQLESRAPHDARTRLHVAPGESAHGGRRIGPFALEALGRGPAPRVVPGEYAPYLGTRLETEVVERTLQAAPGERFGWALLREPARVELGGETLTVVRTSGERVTFALR